MIAVFDSTVPNHPFIISQSAREGNRCGVARHAHAAGGVGDLDEDVVGDGGTVVGAGVGDVDVDLEGGVGAGVLVERERQRLGGLLDGGVVEG